MTVSGIIAEFNPFHNGHKYLLEQAEGLKVVVMSGNFMQRGEPAIVDKWIRAQMALENGADIVVEMPFLVSVQAADYFAEGAVNILKQLGVEKLVFGTEAMMDYSKVVETYRNHQDEMEAYLSSLPDELSYPEKTQLMWQHFADVEFSGESPNHILALAYAKAVAKTNLTMSPVLRQGAGFHSKEKETSFASATALREYIEDKSFVQNYSPSYELLEMVPHVSWDNYFEYLKYQIITQPHLTDIYQVNDELASRIKASIKKVATIDELVDAVATKRYTKARVRRVLTYILVNAREEQLPTGIHILGFSQDGRLHLKKYKKEIELISKIGSQAWDKISQKADEVYQLGHPKISEQTYGRYPIVK